MSLGILSQGILQALQNLRAAAAGNTLIGVLGLLLVVGGNSPAGALGVYIALAQEAVFRYEHLGDVRRGAADRAIQRAGNDLHAAVRQRREGLDQGLHIHSLRELPGLFLFKQLQGFVWEDWGFVSFGSCQLQHLKLTAQLANDLLSQRFDSAGDFVEGVLTVLPVPPDANDVAAFGSHVPA